MEQARRVMVIGLSTGVGVLVAYGVGLGGLKVGGLSALLWCALIAFGVQWLAAIPAILWRTEKFYDLTGSLTYLSLMGFGLWVARSHGRLEATRGLVAALVCVWALRLGFFLMRRIHRDGKDGRFDEIKRSVTRFLVAWTLQGLWVLLTSLAALVLLTMTQRQEPVDLFCVLGWSLWIVGFLLEVIADAQKSVFAAKPENKGKWIDVGLWKYSQHPNYFGEIVLWTGIFVSGVGSYAGWQWLVVLSPAFVFVLLVHGSGIPLLDQRAMKKWGDNPAYLAYRERTNVLVLGPRRKPPAKV